MLALPTHEETARTKASILARVFAHRAEHLFFDGCEDGPELLLRLAPALTYSRPYGDVVQALVESFRVEMELSNWRDNLFRVLSK